MNADDLLAELAAKFRALEKFGELAAKEASPLVEAALRATAAAGTDPLGAAWPPKQDGGRPLANAAAHIASKPIGTTIRTTLSGPDVFWHFRQGKYRRQVLPDPGTITDGVEAALRKGADLAFENAR